MFALFSFQNISALPQQIIDAIKILLETPGFIMKHKLWRGFMDNTWVFIFSVIVAALFSYGLYSNLHDYFFSSPENIELISGQSSEPNATLDESAVGTEDEQKEIEAGDEALVKTKEYLDGNHEPLISGGLKFLLLILLEIIIFHFAVKTNNILKNENVSPKFNSFSKAQFRMLKVMGRKWFYVLIIYIAASILCGILGIEAFKGVIMFIVYGYYFGFAFFDNYLEQYDLSIKESAQSIHHHFGAVTVFGIFASLVMNIPLIGPIVVPFLCAIATCRYAHLHYMEDFLN